MVPHTDEEKRFVDVEAPDTKEVTKAFVDVVEVKTPFVANKRVAVALVVVLLVTVALVEKKLVELALVVVPFVAVKRVKFASGANKVPVTLIKPNVEVPTRPEPIATIEKVAFVKLRFVPPSVLIVAEFINAVVKLAEVPQSVVAKRLVEVVLVPVALVQVRFERVDGERTFKLVNVALVPTMLVAKRLVEVLLVVVLFIAIRLVTVDVPAVNETTARSLMTPEAAERVVKVAFVPTTFTLKRLVEVAFVATN